MTLGGGAGEEERRESQESSLRVIRIKNRVYSLGERTRWSAQDGAHVPIRTIKTHTEYAVIERQQIFARIVFNRGGWIVIERKNDSSFGKPISPLNLKRLAEVKEWALQRYASRAGAVNARR